MLIENLAEKITKAAISSGFDDCGLAKIGEIPDFYRAHFEKWLKNGFNANMKWIEKNVDIRFNPKLLLENAKTAVVVLQSHKTCSTQGGKVARYALQKEDYHISMRGKLKILSRKIGEIIPRVKFRFCVDSAPVLEKYWAQKAGLGIIGKNTLFISKKIGSFCNIAVLLIDFEVETGEECETFQKDFCENCGECIKFCPTKALVSPYTLDCNKCISYKTQQKTITDFNCFGWTLGCDICQEVCPCNEILLKNDF